MTYGPNGQSRGIATIIFTNTQKAHEAATQLNGTKVDNRPMKVSAPFLVWSVSPDTDQKLD